MTDRGPKTVPAWLVSLPGATGPIAIVAIGGPARYDPGKPVPLGFTHATIDAAGSSLTLAFVGSAEGTGPCTADYRLALVEHPAFVEAIISQARDGGGTCTALG
jgi:hypothetical protein